jgi:hypothetical protein
MKEKIMEILKSNELTFHMPIRMDVIPSTRYEKIANEIIELINREKIIERINKEKKS